MAQSEKHPTRQTDNFFTVTGNTFKLLPESWVAFKVNLGPIITFTLINLVVSLFLFSMIVTLVYPYLKANDLDQIVSDYIITKNLDVSSATQIALVVFSLGATAITTLISISMIIIQLASARGQKISFSKVLNKALSFFWPMIGVAVLTFLAVIVGSIFLLIPGLLAAFFLVAAPLIMVDQHTGVTESLKKSFELTKKNWKLVLAFLIVQISLQLLSSIWIIGQVAFIILSVAYFCLPSILYLRAIKDKKLVAKN